MHLVSHQRFIFTCISNDECNNEMNAKRMIRSIFIQNQLQQQCSSLIENVPSFNPYVVPCNNIANATSLKCDKDDLQNCDRCVIYSVRSNSPSVEVCAVCPKRTSSFNSIAHGKTYKLNDRRVIAEYITMTCQFERCNSLENMNRVSSASAIFFNLNKYSNEIL